MVFGYAHSEIAIGVFRVTVISLIEGKNRNPRFLKAVVKSERIEKGRHAARSRSMNKEQRGTRILRRHPPTLELKLVALKDNVLDVIAVR